MPFYQRITSLPEIGTDIERAVMDWKVVPAATEFHKAKDVAAFANHLGGTLLLGAAEANGQLAAYVGLSVADAGAVRAAFSKAVANRCNPFPLIDFDEFEDPGDSTRRIVAVHVWPSLLLIGVKVMAHKPTEGWGDSSYVFPVRTGTDADFLQPDQLAMYMTPEVRRIAVLLSRIPKGTMIRVHRVEDTHAWVGRLGEVSEVENIVTFHKENGDKMQNLPLDCIRTVYEKWDSDRQRGDWLVVTRDLYF